MTDRFTAVSSEPSAEEKTVREKGLALFEEVYGTDAAAGLSGFMASGRFGAEIARWANDFSFGTIWSRGKLERKLGSCVVLGMVMALRQSDEIRYHTRMGLANGLTREEIEEILYMAVPYCGFPAANTAKAAMLAGFAEVDAAADKNA